MKNLPWHLTLDINNVRTIFEEQILPYEVECYICNCGKTEIFIKNIFTNLEEYECIECGNIEFYSANKYNNNITWYEDISNIFPEDFLLSLNPKILFNEKEKQFSSDVDIYIPSSIDLASDKISYTKKTIFQIFADKNDFLVQKTNVNFNLNSLLSKNEKDSFNFIGESELINRNTILINYRKKILNELKQSTKSNLLKRTISIEQFNFFFKNNYLLDLDFFYWKNINSLLLKKENIKIECALDFVGNNRKEKTLKKAIYLDYKKQMRKFNTYDFTYIHAIAYCIKDVNVAIRMIELDTKEHLDFERNTYDLYYFMFFLTSYFSDKQIENLFIKYFENEPYWFIDSIYSYLEIRHVIQDFPKIKCNPVELHNNLVKVHKLHFQNILIETKFTYEDIFNEASINLQSYEIKLPQNGQELYEWSNELHNCLSGYYKSIQKRETTIYGFFLENQIKFAVEIRDNQIVQAKAKYNNDLNSNEKDLVFSWFDRSFSNNIIKK